MIYRNSAGQGFSFPPCKAVAYGDSFAAHNFGASSYRLMDWGYLSWTNTFLGSPFSSIQNFGITGETTTEILARISGPLGSGAQWCFLNGGINDFSAGATVATVVANLQSMCEILRPTMNVVLLAIAPNGTHFAKLNAANSILRRWASTVPNVYYVDVFTPLVNPTSATGAFATGMSDDALHPSAKGARAMGSAIATAIAGFVPTITVLPSSAADSVAVDALNQQALTNPLLSGTGGTLSGAGTSGTIASSWSGGPESGSGTSVWLAAVARADGIGVDQQVTITAASSGAIFNFRQTGVAARLALGDTIYAAGSIAMSGMSDVLFVHPSLSIVIDGVTSLVRTLDLTAGTTYDQTDLSFTFKTPEFPLTGAVLTSVGFFMRVGFGTSGTGAAVMKAGRMATYKYTA